jgi:hypothetical protein
MTRDIFTLEYSKALGVSFGEEFLTVWPFPGVASVDILTRRADKTC